MFKAILFPLKFNVFVLLASVLTSNFAWAQTLDEKANAIVKICGLGLNVRAQGELQAMVIQRLKVGKAEGSGDFLERGAVLDLFEKSGVVGENQKYLMERVYNCVDSSKSFVSPNAQNGAAVSSQVDAVGEPLYRGKVGNFWPISCRKASVRLSCSFLFEPAVDGSITISNSSSAISKDGFAHAVSRIRFGGNEWHSGMRERYVQARIFKGTRISFLVDFDLTERGSEINRILLEDRSARNTFVDFVGLKF